MKARVAVFMIFFAIVAMAAVPQIIQYQGKLTDMSGIGENDTLDIRFRIFDVETGGDSLWAMTVADVAIVHGLFDVNIGPIDLPFDEQYWLEIVVDGEVLAPRVQLTSSPYAFRAAVADSLAGSGISLWADSTAFIMVNGQKGVFGYGNVAYGVHDSTHVNLGVACTTGSISHNKYCAILSGLGNIAVGEAAFVGGGESNKALSNYSKVGGGFNNIAEDTFATIGGGTYNAASGVCSFVGGGRSNGALGSYSAVGGGYTNTGSRLYSTVAGGFYNLAKDTASAVGGGSENRAEFQHSTIGGGFRNRASGIYSTIGGGRDNVVDSIAYSSTIAGGYYNTIEADFNTIAGGNGNSSIGPYGAICGGQDNTINNMWYSSIGGGYYNTVEGQYSRIGGGFWNTANDTGSFIGGGARNSVSGKYSVIPGGYADTVNADYSFAFGNRAIVNTDYTARFFSPDYPGTFVIDGNLGIGTSTPERSLHVAGSGLMGGDDYGLSIAHELHVSAGLHEPILRFSTGGVIRWDIFTYGTTNSNAGKLAITNDSNHANTPDMVIDTDGNVGIATTSPARKLHVTDVMRLEPRTTVPTSASRGDMYFNGILNKLMVYDGTTWQACW